MWGMVAAVGEAKVLKGSVSPQTRSKLSASCLLGQATYTVLHTKDQVAGGEDGAEANARGEQLRAQTSAVRVRGSTCHFYRTEVYLSLIHI